MRPRLLLAPVLALLIGAAAPPQPADSPAAQRIEADVEFLASDRLEGRDTGSQGYSIAAAYVARQFAAIGLKPAGTRGGWYEEVPFRRAAHAGQPQVRLSTGSAAIPLTNLDVAVRPSVTQQVRAIDAPLVFVGHGISDPKLGIDEYAGLDVRGKVAVALDGTPPGLASDIAAHLEAWKTRTAAAKGALGLIEIADIGRIFYYQMPITDWVDPTGRTESDRSRLPLSMAISLAASQPLFAAAGRDFAQIRAAGLKGPIRGFALPGRLQLQDRMVWRDFTSPEVIGLLSGADPALKRQYVVLMAHLDHLGVKPNARPGEDAIYNGALDNAAGVATMLEAARKFARSGKPPRRSVLFIANAGEEKGLRGSDYFAAHPTVREGSIVGLVNLDMPLLLYPFSDVIAFGADHSTVGKAVAGAARSMGVAVSPDPMPKEALFVRSDHYRFVTRGIPAILLMTGYGNGGEAQWKDFLAHHYHQVSDDLSQPIEWDQGARYAELNYRIARDLADADQRPLWYQGDYFGDTFAPGQPKAVR